MREALFGPGDLLPGHRISHHARTVTFGRERREATPPTAEVEDAHARAKADLATDQVQLGFLGTVERLGVLEVRAGVHHARTEHRLVKIVADVVVTLSDLEGAGDLQIQKMRSYHLRPQSPARPEGVEEACADHPIDHLVDGLAIPPALDEGLADAK